MLDSPGQCDRINGYGSDAAMQASRSTGTFPNGYERLSGLE
jgi:hypothetical protein